MAPISATYHRIFIVSSSMRKPIIIMATRLAGDGSPSPIRVLTQLMSELEGYDGAIWNVGMPENSELVQRVVSPVASRNASASWPIAAPCCMSCWRSTLPSRASG